MSLITSLITLVRMSDFCMYSWRSTIINLSVQHISATAAAAAAVAACSGSVRACSLPLLFEETHILGPAARAYVQPVEPDMQDVGFSAHILAMQFYARHFHQPRCKYIGHTVHVSICKASSKDKTFGTLSQCTEMYVALHWTYNILIA